MEVQPLLLDEKEAAAALNVSVGLIRKMRSHHQGPPAIKVGARLVRYPFDALQAYIARQLSQQSGADLVLL